MLQAVKFSNSCQELCKLFFQAVWMISQISQQVLWKVAHIQLQIVQNSNMNFQQLSASPFARHSQYRLETISVFPWWRFGKSTRPHLIIFQRVLLIVECPVLIPKSNSTKVFWESRRSKPPGFWLFKLSKPPFARLRAYRGFGLLTVCVHSRRSRTGNLGSFCHYFGGPKLYSPWFEIDTFLLISRYVESININHHKWRWFMN